jgi:putative mRNA 3-end processing factor
MSSSFVPLIESTGKGLYCGAGDFYIDPSRSVKTALITHAHSDHARRGSQSYICTSTSVELLKTRLGQGIQVRGVPYRESFRLGSCEVSFHPAGHILGSAQVRVKLGSEIWVVSGDYKREADPSCEPFESVACDTFVTEATFGTPKYIWKKSESHGKDIHSWWMTNSESGVNSLLFGYSLGKAQRILAELAPHATRPIFIHSSISELTRCYRAEGRGLAETVVLDDLEKTVLSGELILAPPSVVETRLVARLGEYKTAFASGWMQGSSRFRTSSYDHGFVISDHADWNDLNRTIDETGASRVFVLHRNGALVRHLRKRGLDAHPVSALVAENYRKIGELNLSLF